MARVTLSPAPERTLVLRVIAHAFTVNVDNGAYVKCDTCDGWIVVPARGGKLADLTREGGRLCRC